MTGANSETDGEYNTNIIQQIPGYETLYPAFKAVPDLNVNGVTGWYLPAVNELIELYNNGINFTNYWSSTEYDSRRANYHYYGDSSNRDKSNSYRIVAMKKF